MYISPKFLKASQSLSEKTVSLQKTKERIKKIISALKSDTKSKVIILFCEWPQAQAVLQEAVSVYRVHATVLDELEPDLLVTQSQCEVCAVSLADVEAAACELVKSQPEILSLAPNALADIWRDIGAVAKASAVVETGAA